MSPNSKVLESSKTLKPISSHLMLNSHAENHIQKNRFPSVMNPACDALHFKALFAIDWDLAAPLMPNQPAEMPGVGCTGKLGVEWKKSQLTNFLEVYVSVNRKLQKGVNLPKTAIPSKAPVFRLVTFPCPERLIR